MNYNVEKTIVDIKNELTTHLCNILIPQIFDDFKTLYKTSEDMSAKLSKTKTPCDPFTIFRTFVNGIEQMNELALQKEISTIKLKRDCADYFEELIKAVVKSYILVLTYNGNNEAPKLIAEKYYDKISITLFVQKCLVECGIIFKDNPWIFMNQNPISMSQNKTKSYKLIRNGIITAVHKSLPMKYIITEFIEKDFNPQLINQVLHNTLPIQPQPIQPIQAPHIGGNNEELIKDPNDIFVRDGPQNKFEEINDDRDENGQVDVEKHVIDISEITHNMAPPEMKPNEPIPEHVPGEPKQEKPETTVKTVDFPIPIKLKGHQNSEIVGGSNPLLMKRQTAII